MALKYNKKSLAIIIPMFNEEKVAGLCIDKVLKEVATIKNRISLIVINDGSKDKTLSILNRKAKKYKDKIIIVSHEKNKGYGSALQSGIREAIKNKFEYYLAMDSDLTNPPEYIQDFIEEMSDKVDCVKASRYVSGGGVVNVPFKRKLISIVGNYLASLFFNVGIKDCTNGFKMVRLKLLENVNFKEKNFSIILEEMYYLKKKKARFSEIPNLLYTRKNSKSHFRYTPKVFYDYFKYVIMAAFV